MSCDYSDISPEHCWICGHNWISFAGCRHYASPMGGTLLFLLLLNTNKQNAKAQPYTPPPRTRPQHAIADDGAVPVRAVAQKAAVESPESKHYNLAWSRQIPLDDCNPWNGFACIPLMSLKRQRRTSRDVPAGWWHFPDMDWCCLNKHYYNGQMIGLSAVSAEHWPAEVSLEFRSHHERVFR